MGWRGPLAIVGVTVVALSAILVGVAIYSCDLDEVQSVSGLSDGLKTLIATEKSGKRGATPGRQVMQVQGAWAGMTLRTPDPAPPLPPLPTAGGGVQVAARRPSGVVVASIDTEEGNRARGAGIRPGDTIVGVGDKKVGGLADLRAATEKLDPRQPLMINILRQGQLMTMVLPAASLPLASLPTALAGPNAYCPRDGVLIPPGQAATGVCPICGGPLYLYNGNPQVNR